MLQAIKSFFQLNIAVEVERPETREHGLRLATAALLFEMMRADFDADEEERKQVVRLVQREFGLDQAEMEVLEQLADQEAQEAVSLHQFTSLINEHFSLSRKVRVIEMLWQVAYADGVLDKYEEAMVRKVAELLYVSHRDFMQAKHRVQEAIASASG